MGEKAEKKDGRESDGRRDTWSNPIECFLTLVSYCVGPGNILRFPYLCMRNGGGAFLVPYFICLFLCGMPLYTLELIMGQASRRGCLGCWDKYGSIFKGIGYTMVLITGVCTFEYQTYMAWIIYYFFKSLTLELPWTTCNATWNTPNCILTTGNYSYDKSDGNFTTTMFDNATRFDASGFENSTTYAAAYDKFGNASSGKPTTAVEEFFQNEALKLSSGIDDIGGLQWQLVVAHVVGWTIQVVCLIKGIRSSGKVVYVSATLPYVIITIFLVRAALLPGFMDGINLYITPNFEALKTPEVWMMAFLQIFFSLGPGWGCMISMSSFSAYKHNFLWEAIFCPIVCCLTSFYSGFVTFGAAGFLARKKGLPVEEAMKSGPGIAFISFPELASHLPGGPFWSALFFVMMFNVLLGSQLVQIETCVSAVTETFNMPRRYHKYVLLVFAFLNLTFGLIFFTDAGMYAFQFVDWYFSIIVVFVVCTCECVCVFWLYGFERFRDDVYAMIGRRPSKLALLPLWGVFIPLVCVVSIGWSVWTVSAPKFGAYVFPDWCASLGWTMAVSMLAPAVVYVLVRLLAISRSKDFRPKLWELVRPAAVRDGDDTECLPMNADHKTKQNDEVDV